MAAFAKRYFRYSKNSKHQRSSRERSLLWPVYVYRITYPDIATKTLNLFQEGILGLLRAGCKHPAEIAKLLSLDIDLVKFIIEAQLEPNGWIKNNRITNEGRLVLDGKEWRNDFSMEHEDEPDTVKLKIGYAFWDTIGQKWMPRMASHLPELEPVSNPSKFPVFEKERQKGGTYRPYRLTPQDTAAPKIDAEDILNAYRTYRLDIHHARQLGMPAQKHHKIAIQSFNVMSDDPEPAYLWVSLIRDEYDIEPWAIVDPFHIRTKASWLRKPIQDHISSEPELAKRLAQFIGTAQADNQTAEQWLQAMDDETSIKLLSEYSYLANHKQISRYLSGVLQHQIKIKEGIEHSSQLEALLTELQKLIESILKWMLGKWTVELGRLPGPTQRIGKDKMKQIYQGLPLSNIPDSCFDQLSRQNWRTVHKSLRDKNNASAKAYLCGAILTTLENPDHPFATLSESELNISKLLYLCNTRNAAGHASGQEFSKHEVLELSQFTLQWIGNFKEHF